MKRLIIASLVLGVTFLGLQVQASANLLADSSFEGYSGAWTGLDWSSTPWYGGGGNGIPGNYDIGGGAGITNSYADSGARSALLFQYGTAADGETWSYATVGQKNIIPITGDTTYVASAMAKRLGSIAGAQAYIKVEWLDGTGSLISEASGSSQLTDSSPENIWMSLSDNFVSPETAAKAKFEVVFDRTSTLTGDPADIAIDTANFDVIPEPSSLMLFASGLAGLIGIGRRRKRS